MKCLLCEQNLINKSLTVFEFFISHQKKKLCDLCLTKFQKVSQENSCPHCLKKGESSTCSDCQKWCKLYPEYNFKNESLYYYNEVMENFFQQYKFAGDYRLRNIFCKDLAKALRKYRNWFLVPIPISKERKSQRLFNQVEGMLLASNKKYYSALVKVSEVGFQSHKNRKERLTTRQPFLLKPEAFKILKFQKVLLIDDIYTTGRTLFHAYDAVKESRPQKILTFTLAR